MDAGSVLVRVERGGFVESEHRGHAAVVRADGQIMSYAGDPGLVTALRSAAKPFQLLAVLRSGAADRFGFTDEELAVMAGSHAGTPRHVAVVSSALKKAGLRADDLQCGAHAPFDPEAAAALARAGETPTVLHNNCSGKHTGMLAAAKAIDARLDTYLDPEHPVQRLVHEQVAWACGLAPEDVGTAIDGCSAPTFFVPLAAGARAFARLAAGETPALARIRNAMAAHPALVSGNGRLDTLLMQADAAVCAKGGAEAFQGIGVSDAVGGTGIAVKISDGAGRAVGPAALEVLKQVAWRGSVPESVAEQHQPALKNHRGTLVGRITPTVSLKPA